MTSAQLMQEGLNLMLSGMSFVLVFLLILIFAIKLMSKLISYFSSEPVSTPQNTSTSTTELTDLERLRPVIVAAIAHHRRQQGLQ
ncbi:oxaloacetate decarboxylase subunit gamma [Canicola haemoglobinophilus]|uniref:Probable oxaloacetate decarboxylase gamma chain n=1 Tax=Canicola haemoglobinophilus TaxID=733 RepID=A0AB38HBL3_9PAST|nr:oxaloacetate decarboxylase subunit gamma [Canicola haemoglobinophilus]MBN6710886.1 oxaloacetate decarboxylase subunit gamma [Canicola haemoglobinophilus]MBN6712040.1 oxaloacetate decarboxylase subunit gamma [Canicola haemoglobinophilus]STO54796.1 oxaloacetate decarboxylase subunit gamma [Canicola haemoglobinophilus]STO69632.1 oxaloacetate decarboxylase subunit gamma [Canicola haemoglobinophilus]